ncbi:lipopolysaccharide biosynthesis protein [Marinococcus halotolerans]|uniref:lipopolysaccharide biosynthesis protein n=1 Tax=Marinococcus halotolerans TaxID=301092 RepID=UPI0003B51D56|nr:oligosaccharide flippase family protein [Marinococcus halotolerans]
MNTEKISLNTGITFAALLISSFFSFLNLALIARAITSHDFGMFTFFQSILLYLFILAMGGTEQTLLKLIPLKIKRGLDSYYSLLKSTQFFLTITSIFTVLVLVSIFPFVENYTQFDNVYMYILPLTLIIPAQTIILYFKTFNRSEFAYIRSVIPEKIIRPIAFFIILLIFNYLNLNNIGYIFFGFFLSYAIGALFSILFNRKTLIKKTVNFKFDSEIIKLAPSFTSIRLLNQFGPVAIVLLLGILVSGEEVGFFRAPQQTSSLINMVIMSMSMVFFPIMSNYYANERNNELEKMYKISTKWTLILGGFICLPMLIAPGELLLLFGEEFSQYGYVLQILVIGQLIKISTGSCGNLLLIMGEQKKMLINTSIQVLLTLIIAISTIPYFGLFGAALSITLSVTILNIMLVISLWKISEMHPFTRSYFGVFISILITVGVVNLIFVNVIIEPNSLSMLLKFLLIYFVYSALIYFTALDNNELDVLKNKIKKIF